MDETVEAPDTTPPGEDTQEYTPEEEGEKYDGGEIPPATEEPEDE